MSDTPRRTPGDQHAAAPDRPGWLPAEAAGDTVTPTRVGAAWDAVRARLPEWAAVLERIRRQQPGIHDRRAGTVTWLVPQGAPSWWRTPIGIERLASGSSVLVPPVEAVYRGDGGPEQVVHWTTAPMPHGGMTCPDALLAAIHAAQTDEWMPRDEPELLPVGRWWEVLLAPRHRVWSVVGRMEHAPAIVSEETMAWLLPAQALDPDDLPEGCRLLVDGPFRVPPASAARGGPHTRVPHLHWSTAPRDRAVICPPNRLLRELRTAVPMPRTAR